MSVKLLTASCTGFALWLKSRYTGDVGVASHLLYDSKTGRLKEMDDYDESQFDGDII